MQTRHRQDDWFLPCAPASAGEARRHVAGACSGLGREFHDVAVLLTSELVGNAVEHAQGDIQLVVSTGPDRFRVEVHDQSSVTPTPQLSGGIAPRGRGLMLVERLSSEWGVDPSPRGGKQVWFQLRLPRGRR
jgi:anti-sigma regulatory factor (Ser/Thr protein kinase)